MLHLLQLSLTPAICLVSLCNWMGRKGTDQRGNKESCGSFSDVLSQRSCPGTGNWGVLLSEWGGRALWFWRSLTWMEIAFDLLSGDDAAKYLPWKHTAAVPSDLSICHCLPCLPIYSHAASENCLRKHDWNELSLFKLRNLSELPSCLQTCFAISLVCYVIVQVAY